MADIFDEKFISELPDDNVEAWHKIATKFNEFENGIRNRRLVYGEFYENYLDIYGFLMSMLEIRPVDVNLEPPSFNSEKDILKIQEVFKKVGKQAANELRERHKREVFTNARDKYPSMIPGGFAYEFLETDYKRLQELINDLRTLTSESKQIDRDHKRRLLKRIENLQLELHQKMSNLDVFWGLFGDAGIAFGKFGKDIKPLTDRVCEILKIVTRTQARASGLLSGKDTPLLKAVEEFTDQPDKNDTIA
jgi:hypothetical protein